MTQKGVSPLSQIESGEKSWRWLKFKYSIQAKTNICPLPILMHAWRSTQSRLATLLSSKIARRWVRLQTLRRFLLIDLSIDEMVGPDALVVCRAH